MYKGSEMENNVAYSKKIKGWYGLKKSEQKEKKKKHKASRRDKQGAKLRKALYARLGIWDMRSQKVYIGDAVPFYIQA